MSKESALSLITEELSFARHNLAAAYDSGSYVSKEIAAAKIELLTRIRRELMPLDPDTCYVWLIAAGKWSPTSAATIAVNGCEIVTTMPQDELIAYIKADHSHRSTRFRRPDSYRVGAHADQVIFHVSEYRAWRKFLHIQQVRAAR